VTGAPLPSGRYQASQLSGGDDGRRPTLPEYYRELAKGYIAADNMPCRIVVSQGVYVDDVMTGVDFETGLPTQINAGFHTQLQAFLARHSQYVSECIGIMSVRPMSTTNPAQPTLEERENWFNRLISVDPIDGTVAANVISSIADYHLIVTVGDFILNNSKINNGRLYVEGGHNILAAMKFHHDNRASIVTRDVPNSLVRGMVYKIVAADRVNAINAMRYTLFTEDSDSGAFKISRASTMAAANSQFRLQYNLDITIEAVNAVRRVLKPFIGQPNKVDTREMMRNRAMQELQTMSPDKLLGFDIKVNATRNEAISGKCMVQLQLITAVEILTIIITTKLELGF
jgi:hypothetical protein